MFSNRLPPPELLRAIIESEEEHSDQLLTLLDRAAPMIWGGAGAPPPRRLLLADKLERWRYRWLNRCGDRLTAAQRQLTDALDVAARIVRRGPPLSPRSPRGLLSPAGCGERFEQALDPCVRLEQLIDDAREETGLHFAVPRRGTAAVNRSLHWRMRLYAPLYLSSYCINHCLYCHFRFPNQLLRREHLDFRAALDQAEFLFQRGIRHVLIVAGDYPRLTTTDYFAGIVRALTDRGLRVSIEVAPQSTADYVRLAEMGTCGVTLYQETYQEDIYAHCHPRGTKAWIDWRLEGPERAAEAGISRLGLGVLLGLGEPEADLRALIGHARYLIERFPHLKLAFSLPRLHEAPRSFAVTQPVSDETLIRYYCALRLAFPHAELVLSTRERPELRDRLAAICITQMSAESCTSPGGYGSHDEASSANGEQFPVHDRRTIAEISGQLERAGFSVSFGD
jgi:2-iminoacetate synthase